jgi:hypothetical protein
MFNNAKAFGNIIIFDTTHCTNVHGMYLGVFATIDNMGAINVLAWTLTTNQTTVNFTWQFQQYCNMVGQENTPHVIMSDGDFAIASAIQDTFGNTTIHIYQRNYKFSSM